DDFWDNWKEILAMMNYARQWEHVGGPGHWPDCDMLQVGKLSKRGPNGRERYSRFTEDELYTHITFWSIYQSPLMIGGNMPENRALELKLLTNEEVLAVNQHGMSPTQLLKTDSSMIWISFAPGGKDVYVAMFNIGEKASDVSFDFSTLKLKGKLPVRDLWNKTDLGIFKNRFSTKINAHGSVLLKIATNQVLNPKTVSANIHP
ncbi:MAG: hypothetical protein ABIU63_15720, partial [Chitinophagaceae bacterium]